MKLKLLADLSADMTSTGPPSKDASVVLEVSWAQTLIDHLFVGPVWPASVLTLIVFTLVLVSLLGMLSLDFGVEGPEIDAGMDVDTGVDMAGTDMAGTDASGVGHHGGDLFGGFAVATMKAVHLDRVPLMIWLTVFSLLFWVLSFVLWFEFDVRRYPPTFFVSIMLTIRNGVIAVVLTRLLTTPLHRLLIPPTHYHEETLIGGTAVVETSVVDDRFGRARFMTNAAPLLINIRTSGTPIAKGSRVVVVHYDAESKVYHVAPEPLGGTVSGEFLEV